MLRLDIHSEFLPMGEGCGLGVAYGHCMQGFGLAFFTTSKSDISAVVGTVVPSVKSGHSGAVEVLLKYGVNVNTPLIKASVGMSTLKLPKSFLQRM